MPTLRLDKVLSDPKFRTDFIVHRKKGKWQAGRFVVDGAEESINFIGVSQPGGTKDIVQVPEADRSSEIRIFLSEKEMYITHSDDGAGNAGFSDEIEFEGIRYKVFQVKNWKVYGFYRAIGISL